MVLWSKWRRCIGKKDKACAHLWLEREIVTTLEQSRWRSAITVHVEGSSSIQLPFDADEVLVQER